MISTRPELLVELHESVSGQLISRFKEREENVRLDVLACYTELLKATASDTHNQIHNVDAKPSSETLLTDDKIGAIISAGNKLMGQKGTIKTKTAIFTLLRQLTLAAPGRLESFTSMLVPSLTEALAEKSSALKLEALCFLRLLLETHEPTVLQSHMAEVIPLVLTCVGEDWYKSVAEALRVVAAITQAIRPYDEESGLFKGDFDFSPFVTAIFQVPPWGLVLSLCVSLTSFMFRQFSLVFKLMISIKKSKRPPSFRWASLCTILLTISRASSILFCLC